jgi:hypothetical protein
MAMRRYSRAEFESELSKKWQLEPTEHRTDTTIAWHTPKGSHVLVPAFQDAEQYPDHILNLIEDQLEKLGEHPFKK